MVAPVILQYGLPFLVQVLSESLGKIDSPVARAASKSLGTMQDALTTGAITPEQLAEANRHAEALAALRADETKTAYAQINESLRTEIASDDPYVRRMRPTFGYLMALTWAAQMFGLAYIVVFRTDRAADVFSAMESLTGLWAMGLSVMGIYVYKRSEDKKITGAGLPPSAAKPAPAKASKAIPPAPAAPPPPSDSGFNLNP